MLCSNIIYNSNLSITIIITCKVQIIIYILLIETRFRKIKLFMVMQPKRTSLYLDRHGLEAKLDMKQILTYRLVTGLAGEIFGLTRAHQHA